ncbi:tRNA 2-thiouridine synthesizing protein A [Sphingomonas sp. PP-CE-3A-406]|uniref:sulfurtransferase TusA family protein n=1 Tax=Sphingomonas sp. PP-CE-3A-406 TaxID=2135659 RepID=UPI000EFA2DED|nr:sulfurtransferase TusA family protein [Sphingomonas sp. PP-CE-3A-406]RMB53873.1 tRNA 2-thiouridine synthesizing protein A [Sphingomonas sp. PP-CE-3A-406]
MVRIDARGMRCPWPAMRLARVLRDGARTVEILADDPQASTELAAAAEAADATIKIILDETYRTYVVTCR